LGPRLAQVPQVEELHAGNHLVPIDGP
jgi:hypothetical protein